jgi:hypothetical protein
VQKVGLSPIDVAEVYFSIPVQWYEPSRERITLLELYSPKVELNKYLFLNIFISSSSYKALQPIQGSGLLNRFLPTMPTVPLSSNCLCSCSLYFPKRHLPNVF